MDEPQILVETQDIIAVDKPAGLIAHSDGRTEEPSLAEWLIARCPFLAEVGEPWVSPQGESVRVGGLVHRLDRGTSGILVAAKSNEIFAYLRSEFRARRVEKTYHAYVYGHMDAAVGRIVAEIARSGGQPKRWYAHMCEEADARAAITNWKLVENTADPATGEDAALLELTPETGRTHQIRVHLASIQHPIVADHLYAAERPSILGFERLALHASRIALTLPSGERVEYEVSLASDFPASAIQRNVF
jgi:23S rRNA pseudouridine1911/1915/1917 synthase